VTAAVGFPTLRLIRVRIGCLSLAGLKLKPGEWRELDAREQHQVLQDG
ncbi:MAG: pseudouridine synthase, partial [Prosthecobacter sp.]